MQQTVNCLCVNTRSQAPCPPEHANACHLNHSILVTVTKQCLQNSIFNYFNTCTMHLLLFCTMANKCTVNWQSIIICQLIVHWQVILQNKKLKKEIQYLQVLPYPTKVNSFSILHECEGFISFALQDSSFCSMNSWTPKRSKCTEKTPLHTDINLVQLFKL